jgi:hypothetical protein
MSAMSAMEQPAARSGRIDLLMGRASTSALGHEAPCKDDGSARFC